MDKSEKIYKFARSFDKVVNTIVVILFLLLLLYAGYSLWHTNSLQNDSFLSDELAKYKPGSGEDSLADLMRLNPDVTSWIVIDGTNIDYPVVQGENDEEYLNRSVLGEFSLAGSLFLSATNKRDFSDPYSLVYGHHVDGGAMLSDVLEFRDASFFKNHKHGTLWYPDKNGKPRADRIEIFALVDTDENDQMIYPDLEIFEREQIPGLLSHVMEKAVNKRPVGSDLTRQENTAESTRIIALSTCEDAVSSDRVLLFGRLVPMTDHEIQKAADESSGPESTSEVRKGGFPGLFTAFPPWALISGGILLLILLIYVALRVMKRMREEKR